MLIKFSLFLYALLAIFVAGGLFFHPKEKTTHRLLSLFVLLFGLEMMDYLYSTSPIRNLYPSFFGRYYFLAGFLQGPVLWLYMESSITPKGKLRWRDIWHLIIPVIIILLYLDIFMMPGPERLIYMHEHFIDRLMPLNYARAGSQLLYGIALIYLVSRWQQTLAVIKRVFTLVLVGIYFLGTVLISWLTHYANSWDDFIIFYFIIATIVMLIAGLLYTRPNFLLTLSKKYLNSGIPAQDMQRIHKKITRVFEDEQLYLDSSLNLKSLATAIDESPHHISQTFSRVVEESFREHINRYRIDHAKELLRSPDFQHYTIEAIAEESGFNNRVTFAKAFTKYTQTKPSLYRDQT